MRWSTSLRKQIVRGDSNKQLYEKVRSQTPNFKHDSIIRFLRWGCLHVLQAGTQEDILDAITIYNSDSYNGVSDATILSAFQTAVPQHMLC